MPLTDPLPVAGTTLGSSSTSLVTPRPPLGVLLILQRASAHAPAGREEDEHGDDNQYHRHEELQKQHRYPHRSVVPLQVWVELSDPSAARVPSGFRSADGQREAGSYASPSSRRPGWVGPCGSPDSSLGRRWLR